MDILTTLFIASILVSGFLLVAFVFGRSNRKVNFGDESRTLYQQALKAYRRMERQRGRVWSKVDDLHVEFIQKSMLEDRAKRLLLPALQAHQAQTTESEVSDEYEKAFNINDIQDAYEKFLREDYLLVPSINCPIPSNKSFQPPV